MKYSIDKSYLGKQDHLDIIMKFHINQTNFIGDFWDFLETTIEKNLLINISFQTKMAIWNGIRNPLSRHFPRSPLRILWKK